jgi:HB1, ASXL, restriction endonuclease HTH domain
MTFYEAALQILKSSGKPLTSAEITERALAGGLIVSCDKTPVATMDAELYRSTAEPNTDCTLFQCQLNWRVRARVTECLTTPAPVPMTTAEIPASAPRSPRTAPARARPWTAARRVRRAAGPASFFSVITKAGPTAAIGTSMRNTDPHQKWAISSPPMAGPRQLPSPAVPAQTPMAPSHNKRRD